MKGLQMKFTRRQFIQTVSALAALETATPFYLPAEARGANERILVGQAGAGIHGVGCHLEAYTSKSVPVGAPMIQRDNFQFPGFICDGADVEVQVAYVADPDLTRAQSAAKMVSSRTKSPVKAIQDAREILDDPSIDVLSIATCNHWHALLGIWASQAGKHSYIEKPVAFSIQEGRKLLQCEEKYGLCMQHGTHRRNFPLWYKTAAAFRSGKYGKPLAVHAFSYRPRPALGFQPECDPPKTLDWDLWTGPANLDPYHANHHPYNWHWFWNTGNGEIGNTGVHYLDLCRMALEDPQKHPANVRSFGTRLVEDEKNHYKDQCETPMIQFVTYDFGGGIPCFYEAVCIRSPNFPVIRNAVFHTEEGQLTNGQFFPKNGGAPVAIELEDFKSCNPYGWFGNFLTCVRDNTPEKLNAPMKIAHYSAALAHLANISYRLGQPASWEECVAAMGGNEILQKRMENVHKEVQKVLTGVDWKNYRFTLGESLTICNETETFPGNDRANALLGRKGRKPYFV